MLWCFGMNERRSVHFIIHRDMLIQLYNKIVIKKMIFIPSMVPNEFSGGSGLNAKEITKPSLN